MNAKNVLHFAADQEAKFVSVRFTDLAGAGTILTFLSPVDGRFVRGRFRFRCFEPSRMGGDQRIRHAAVPDASRFWIDPFTEDTTICLIANVVEPITKDGYRSGSAFGRDSGQKAI